VAVALRERQGRALGFSDSEPVLLVGAKRQRREAGLSRRTRARLTRHRSCAVKVDKGAWLT
jgi:hypothetical protein